jgi:proteasome lid subunit RPN8/RPN11
MIIIANEVITATIAVCQTKHRWGRRHESILYWAGTQTTRNDVLITTCIAPRAKTTPGSFRTTAADNARAISAMNNEGLQLVAQVHSHPGTLVDHSHGDVTGALMPFEGFLSIVVPEYGSNGMWPLHRCGVHRYERGIFRRLTSSEVQRGFQLRPSCIDLR